MRLYRALLHLYPSSFRAEYGKEMCGVFNERRRNASGRVATIGLWIETIFDVLVNAIQVHGDLLRQDLRYAARTFLRAPGFALTAILLVALGVGATTAVFTITDHVLIRRLPFSDPDRLVKLWENRPPYTNMTLSPPNYRDWKNMSTVFESMEAYRGLSVNMSGRENLNGLKAPPSPPVCFPCWACRQRWDACSMPRMIAMALPALCCSVIGCG